MCHVTQPTLSDGNARLERDLGRSLFIRSNRRVELTAAGARLAERARAIEARFVAARSEAGVLEPTATRRIGWLSTLAPAWTERFLAELATLSGTAAQRIEIIEGRERELLDGLARGRIDLALTILRPGLRMSSQPVLTEGYGIALPSRHPLAGREEAAAEDLAAKTMIVRRHCELLSETSRHFTACGVRPFFAARTIQESLAQSYVRAGLGITVMPDSFVVPGIAIRPIGDFHHSRTPGILYPLQGETGQGAVEAALIRAATAGAAS
jgi:DNA-binding transcriptional LysR family regulator